MCMCMTTGIVRNSQPHWQSVLRFCVFGGQGFFDRVGGFVARNMLTTAGCLVDEMKTLEAHSLRPPFPSGLALAHQETWGGGFEFLKVFRVLVAADL